MTARDDLAKEYTWILDSHVIYKSQGLMTLGHEVQTMDGTREREKVPASRKRSGGDSRRPSWSLGLQQLHLKYYTERALKRLLNPKPSTTILGSSHTILGSSHAIVHVILGLTDAQVRD